MKKQVLSVILATACAASMAIPAFAEAAADTTPAADATTTTERGNRLSVNVATHIPEISVTLPDAVEVGLNPYKLTIKVNGTDFSDTVFSPEYAISNSSACPVGIYYVAQATGTNVTISSDPVDESTETDKKVYFEIAATPATTATADGKGVVGDYDDADAKSAAITDTVSEKALLIQLAEATKAEGSTKATPTKGALKITGSAATKPDSAWSAKDKVVISMTYYVVPVAVGEVASAGGNGGGGSSSTPTADVSKDVVSTPGAGWTIGNLVANNTYELTCDKNDAGNWTPSFTGYTITGCTSDNGAVTARASDGRLTGVSDGTANVTYTLEKDDDNSEHTFIFKVTVINS